MKKTVRKNLKLKLNRETLSILEEHGLTGVAGGVIGGVVTYTCSVDPCTATRDTSCNDSRIKTCGSIYC